MIIDKPWFQLAITALMFCLFAWAMRDKTGCGGDCCQGRKQCNCKEKSE